MTADRSGPTIKAILSKEGYEVKYSDIVPDDEEKIRSIVKTWSSTGDIDLVLTTGGTGFGERDMTPEVCSFRKTTH